MNEKQDRILIKLSFFLLALALATLA